MLAFNDLYNISQGIFLAFKNNSKQRQLSVGHSDKVRQRFRYLFPSRFETYTKENFVLTCLYICFKKAPSSFDRFLEILKDIDFNKDVMAFKDSVKNYKHYIVTDVNYIRENYGSGSKEILFSEYNNNKIHFYTLWFYLKYNNINTFGYIEQIQINKLKILFLYLTFSEQSLSYIQELFKESSLLS